jgi:hypothetical protein
LTAGALLRVEAISGTNATAAAATPQPCVAALRARAALGATLTRADANFGRTVVRILWALCAAALLK